MSSYIRIPELNPLKWLKFDNNTLDDFFANAVTPESPEWYAQPFEQKDTIRSQVRLVPDRFTSYKMELVDEDLNVVKTALTTVIYQDVTNNYNYIDFAVTPTALVGTYYALITLNYAFGGLAYTDRYISEPLDIQVTHDGTVPIDYGHDLNDYDMMLHPLAVGKTGLQLINYTSEGRKYRLRIHAGLWSKDITTASSDTIYIDQTHSPRILSAVPYKQFTWTFGNARGFPVWMFDKLARIFCCAYTQIDGLYYVKEPDATLEAQSTERYPMRTATLLMALRENVYSSEYERTVSKIPKGIGTMIIGSTFVIH